MLQHKRRAMIGPLIGFSWMARTHCTFMILLCLVTTFCDRQHGPGLRPKRNKRSTIATLAQASFSRVDQFHISRMSRYCHDFTKVAHRSDLSEFSTGSVTSFPFSVQQVVKSRMQVGDLQNQPCSAIWRSNYCPCQETIQIPQYRNLQAAGCSRAILRNSFPRTIG